MLQPVAPVVERPAPPAKFRYALHGFVKGGWVQVQRDEESFLVGRVSGFRLYNTRLGLSGGYGSALRFELSADTDVVGDPSRLADSLQVSLRDAWVEARAWHLSLRVGQFKTPFNGESLLPDGELPFPRRSVFTDGMGSSEGRMAWAGLTLDRQLGAMAGLALPLGPVLVKIDAAAVNGNGRNMATNDKRVPAAVVRQSVSVAGHTFGVSELWNWRTTGPFAALQNENDVAYEADLMLDLLHAPSLHLADLRLFGMFGYQVTEFATTQAPSRASMGATGFLSAAFDLPFGRLEPVVRGTWYEPDELVDDSGLLDITGGLNYYLPRLPVRLMVDYTRRLERPSRTYPNDLVEAIVQASF